MGVRNKCAEKGQQSKEKEEKYFTLKHMKYTFQIAYACRRDMLKKNVILPLYPKEHNCKQEYYPYMIWVYSYGTVEYALDWEAEILDMNPVALTSYLRESEQVPQSFHGGAEGAMTFSLNTDFSIS